MTTRYITGATNAPTKAVAAEYDLGLLMTPDTAALRRTTTWHGPAGTLGGYGATVGKGGAPKAAGTRHYDPHPTVAYDNGAFSGGRAYDPETIFWPWYLAFLAEHGHLRGKTDFVTIPDKLDWFPELDDNGNPVLDKKGKPKEFCVGDVLTTLEWAEEWIPRMKAAAKAAGWEDIPLAFVAQDGIEELIDMVPWDDITWVFLGGSDAFKEGYGAERITKEALARGKRVHMGRVNSYRRMVIADRFGCHTADGTYIGKGPETNLPNVMEWLDKLNDRTPGPAYAAARAKADTRALAKKKAKVRSLAAKRAAKTRAANKARAMTTTRKAA